MNGKHFLGVNADKLHLVTTPQQRYLEYLKILYYSPLYHTAVGLLSINRNI